MHTPQTDNQTPRPLTLVVLFLALLGARLLGGHFASFYQVDEVSLANGVAALLRHNDLADSYRYGPQVGYHRLVLAIDLLLGGNARAIPIIMIALSALGGAIIPVCGLVSFPTLLTKAERWALAGFLAINPILWMSSMYGNSTTPAIALLALSVAWLSQNPGRVGEAIALALFAAAVVVRADTVLAAPFIALLLWQRYASVRNVLLRGAPYVIVLGALYAWLFVADPRMASSASDVGSHLTNPFPTEFWEYLLWSTSPVALALAVVGVTELARTRRSLLALMAAWCVPFFAFYFGATTTPRYFIPTIIPVAVLSAVGAFALARLLAPTRARAMGAVIGAVCVAPLFVGLGWFSSSSWRNLLNEAQFETQVGPMWTGALLYKSYVTPRLFAQSLRSPAFGRSSISEWPMDSSLATVADGGARGRTIVVLLSGWNGHAFHFYANVHGAKYVSRAQGPIFATETWMELGGARVMSIARRIPEYRAMSKLPLKADDEVWMTAWNSTDEAFARTQIPDGLAMTLVSGADRPVRRYVVRAKT